MTQAAEVLSDPIVAAVAEQAAPADAAPDGAPDGAEPAPATPTKQQELSALAAAEKAAWRARKAAREQGRSYSQREAQRESELQAAREKLQRIEAMDPLDYAEQRGLTADQLAQRVIKRGSQEHAVETLAEKITRLEKAAEEGAQKQRVAQFEAGMRAKEDEFMGFVTADAHPALTAMGRAAALDLGHSLAAGGIADAKRRGTVGYSIDPQRLANYAEKKALEKLEKDAEVYARARGKLVGTTKDSAAKDAQADRTGTTGPRTLTNAAAAERGSMPVNFDELSDAEQNKILAQKLREGWRG